MTGQMAQIDELFRVGLELLKNPNKIEYVHFYISSYLFSASNYKLLLANYAKITSIIESD
jgi:hypothetical protein